MTPANLDTIERALVHPAIAEDEAVSVLEALGELRRRDWAVRVLDAWRKGSSVHRQVTLCDADFGGATVQLRHGNRVAPYAGANEDAARHAAALAVLPSLPADVRAKLECWTRASGV